MMSYQEEGGGDVDDAGFFDAVDSMAVEDQFGFEIWLNEPQSVEERRRNFLSQMGVSSEANGAELASSRSNGDEEISVCSERECVSEAKSVVEDDYMEEKEEFDRRKSGDRASTSTEGDGRKTKRRWSWKEFVSKKRESEEVSDVCSKVKRLVKVKSNKKKYMELTGLLVGQEIQAHKGCIWTMKFSPDGQYLATGGEDGIVRVWQVGRTKTNRSSVESLIDKVGYEKGKNPPIVVPERVFRIEESPIHKFEGHSSDVLDLAWSSSSNFLLSCSKDKTVRLWQVGVSHCLHAFHHNNYVTCVQFNPVDENCFITGSIDGKVRIWGVATCRVIDWADVREVISCVCYRPNGKGFVVGSIHGRCWFYERSENYMQLEAEIRIQGGKRTSSNRITGIQFSQEKTPKVMITSKDSKVRIFDGFDLVHKFKGLPKSGSQKSASFTSSGNHIVSVGNDSQVYLWNHHDQTSLYSTRPSSKHIKSETSCEHFFSQDVSVAVPWPGSNNCISFLGQHGSNDRGRRSRGAKMLWRRRRSSAVTWPEERLPGWDRKSLDVVPETWGMVIVTGSLDGKVSSFTNYGMPVRL